MVIFTIFPVPGILLVMARDLAEKINGTLIPVTAVIDQDRIETDATVIGLVFPIYDFKPPRIIGQFIRKPDNPGAKYLLAVCTYGISPGNALQHFEKELNACGGDLPEELRCICRITGLDRQISPAFSMNRCSMTRSNSAKSFMRIFMPEKKEN